MTQGKIERYHRSMRNVVKLGTYYYPWQLEQAIGKFVEHYNHHRYHESLNNVTAPTFSSAVITTSSPDGRGSNSEPWPNAGSKTLGLEWYNLKTVF